MYLNLDPQFTPFGTKDSIQFESFVFNGGEPHIKISKNTSTISEITITTRIHSFNDFGFLLMAIDTLKRMGVLFINLFIPYFPAARQDRVMVPGEPLSVKVYAEILNALHLKSVTVFDVHSEVTPAVLKNCVTVENYSFIKEVLKHLESDTILISPDGGALKKIYKLSEFLGGVTVVECSKKRNVTNGKLEGFKVYEEDLKGANCLIVDDICDGGGTFVGLAKELKSKNAGKLYLAVSHGIFSKGFDSLTELFDEIYTTDSFKTIESSKIVQVKLENLLR